MGAGAELETMLKNESKNEMENGHFCKSKGRVPFFQNNHFRHIFISFSKFIFEKMRLKMRSK